MITRQKSADPLNSDLLDQISMAVEGDPFWENHVKKIMKGKNDFGIHLAIFVEPYLTFILEGKKTVESRFSVKRIPPYNKIFTNDIILLKCSGGPIMGLCSAGSVWNYQLDPNSWNMIKREFAQSLCAQDPEFWSKRQHTSFVTLIRINNSRKIEPISFSKHDRRGWVVIQRKDHQTKLS